MVKKQEATSTAVTPAVPPAAPATPAVAAQPAPAPTKQEVTLLKLTIALREKRQIAVKPEMLSSSGNKLVVLIGEGWPTISIGKAGGVTVDQLRSYADPFEAAIFGDELYKKQNERNAKRAAALAAPAVAAAPTAPAPKADAPAVPVTVTAHVEKATPAAKKAAAHKQIETKLSQASA